MSSRPLRAIDADLERAPELDPFLRGPFGPSIRAVPCVPAKEAERRK